MAEAYPEWDMSTTQHGFHYAWESLLLDFEEVLVGNAPTGSGERARELTYPVFDRPFSIVKLFHHSSAEMGLELRADGYNAVLSIFRHDGASPDESIDDTTGPGTEIGNVSVNYDQLLDRPDEVMARLISFLPKG
jgi:hypothetical protein